MAISEKGLLSLINLKIGLEKLSTISSDGKNLLTRIPKDIRESLNLKKGDKLRWILENGENLKLEVVKNAKKKKKRT